MSGLIHMEKTADKWGKNGKGDEWHEKWWEHYDTSGQTEKWAHKWCSIDPTTPLDAGHAHVWHERYSSNVILFILFFLTLFSDATRSDSSIH